MELQDKLFEDFRKAASEDEQKSFSAQDKVWERINARLDEPSKKSVSIFSLSAVKYWAAAIAIVLGLGISFLYFNDNSNSTNQIVKHQNNSVIKEENSSSSTIAKDTQEKETVAESQNNIYPKTVFSIPKVIDNTSKELEQVQENAIPQEEALDIKYMASRDLPGSFKDRLSVKETFQQENADLNSLELVSINEEKPLKEISGWVVDKTGTALANAKIEVKGLDKTIIADKNGKFSLSIPDTTQYLIVSSFGNETKLVKIGEKHSYKIEVSPDQSNVALLKDINTFSKSGVKDVQTNAPNFSNMRQELASKQMRQAVLHKSSSADPLIIINGAPYNGKFADINSKHIKEMSILPDVTARALYGDRAKNGVIVVTLKKGKTVETSTSNKK